MTKNAIALALGWAIGFGGPALFPGTSWVAWVAVGSAVAFFVAAT